MSHAQRHNIGLGLFAVVIAIATTVHKLFF